MMVAMSTGGRVGWAGWAGWTDWTDWTDWTGAFAPAAGLEAAPAPLGGVAPVGAGLPLLSRTRMASLPSCPVRPVPIRRIRAR
jgi:hypothetical protein